MEVVLGGNGIEVSGRMKDLLKKIDTVNLSARSHNCLERAGICCIGELVLMSE